MFLLRAGGIGLDIEWAGTDNVLGSPARGVPTVRLSGLPGELLLYLFGRRDAACVEVDCSPEPLLLLSGGILGGMGLNERLGLSLWSQPLW